MRAKFTWGAAALVAAALGGCASPPPAPEAKALVQSKYLAPDPILKLKASSATKSAYGIQEWRVYRGRGSVFVTGYDASNKAVKGLAAFAERSKTGEVKRLALRVNDGTGAAAIHSLASNATVTTQALSPSSQAFARRAVLDLARAHVGARMAIRKGQFAAQPLPFCSTELSGIFVNLNACIASAPNDPVHVQQCQAAAARMNRSGNACIGIGGVGRVSSGGGGGIAVGGIGGSGGTVGGLGFDNIDDINLEGCHGDVECEDAILGLNEEDGCDTGACVDEANAFMTPPSDDFDPTGQDRVLGTGTDSDLLGALGSNNGGLDECIACAPDTFTPERDTAGTTFPTGGLDECIACAPDTGNGGGPVPGHEPDDTGFSGAIGGGPTGGREPDDTGFSGATGGGPTGGREPDDTGFSGDILGGPTGSGLGDFPSMDSNFSGETGFTDLG